MAFGRAKRNYLGADNRIKPLSQIVIAHKNGQGKVEYLSTIARDISEIRDAQASLIDSKLFLEAILDAMSSQIAVVDSQGTILMNNATWKKSHGATNNDTNDGGLGQPYYSFVDPHVLSIDLGAPLLSIIQDCIENHRSRKQTTYQRTIANSTEWYQMTVDQFISRNQEYYVIANLRITAQIRAEHEARYRSDLLDACQQPIISSELDGTILTWNQGATMLYGYNAEVAIGKTVHELLDSRHRVSNDAISAELATMKRWSGELEQTTQNGEQRDVISLQQIIERSDGTKVILESNHDITERKAIARTLVASEQRYRQLANVLPHLIWTADMQGKSEYVNEQWDEVIGTEPLLNGSRTLALDCSS